MSAESSHGNGAVTLAELRTRHGRTWTISDAVGGGWYAVRRVVVSAHGSAHGLSDVRCGATLTELARNLEAETRLEGQIWMRAPSQRAS
ncbi:hypothetical protein ACQPYK_44885 [Streptosporangium sp. CA-135522]|uniref:hypothetical protein n=1 Tax=Streptosporangium sp. CA-135522 TaxID=3240072 RepID=UPI003D90C70A